jgi:hypothetical protein
MMEVCEMNVAKYVYKYVFLTKLPAIRRNRNRKKYPENYENMLKYKGIHKGERCFIIATGPSLKIEDVEMLKDEITFGMNSGIYLMEKADWQPSYYVSQDKEVYEKLGEDIKKIDERGIVKFIGDTATQTVEKKDVLYTLNLYNHLYGTKRKISFSEDCYKYISDGWTVTYSAIQLAVYMGFEEIYLLGCDSNYMGKKHAETCVKQGENEVLVKGQENFKVVTDIAYSCAFEYAKEKGIKIYNATRGGMLEVFPRVELEDILSTKRG